MMTVDDTTIRVSQRTIIGWSRQLSVVSPPETALSVPHIDESYIMWCTESPRASPTDPRSPPHHMMTASFHVHPVPSRLRMGKAMAMARPRASRMMG